LMWSITTCSIWRSASPLVKAPAGSDIGRDRSR
jgi:hypothetical protein